MFRYEKLHKSFLNIFLTQKRVIGPDIVGREQLSVDGGGLLTKADRGGSFFLRQPDKDGPGKRTDEFHLSRIEFNASIACGPPIKGIFEIKIHHTLIIIKQTSILTRKF